MYLNLPLAVFWLALGSFLILRHWLHPDAQDWLLFGTGLSVGWLCLVMAVYNLARWWSIRSRSQRQGGWEKRWESKDKPGLADKPIDPNFQFNETPPPPQPEDP